MKNTRFIAFSATLLVSTVACTFNAQAAPDAGTMQQQIDRERVIKLPKKAPSVEVAPQALMSLPSETITVKTFIFKGNSLLTSEQLSSIVASYLGRPINFSDLQQATAAIANAYRDAGWVVRAYLPAQDVTEGLVTIEIVEAVFGGIKLEGVLPKRVKQNRLQDTVDAVQAKGQLLNIDKLDRAILLLDDLPGVTVTGTLQKGEGLNETDVTLKTGDEPLLIGDVTLDNTGSYSTGSERLTSNLYLNSLLGLGDQTVANLIHTLGSDYGRLAISIPLGVNGWRVEASGSYLEYKLVKGAFSGLGNGTSATTELNASYPLIRSRLKNLYLGFNLDHKVFNNEINQVTSTRYDINNFSASLNGNLFDKLGGNGSNAVGLTLSSGEVNLSNEDTRKTLPDHFTKLHYSLNRQQAITDKISIYAALSGQAAKDNLDSSEKFYLGGAYGVRAYPSSEGGGDDGRLFNLEMRARLQQNLNLASFYDVGHISDKLTGAGLNGYSLKGYGLSTDWTADFGLNLKATWARRIGNNPNPTATGNDQDGTLRKNRFWLSATLPF